MLTAKTDFKSTTVTRDKRLKKGQHSKNEKQW